MTDISETYSRGCNVLELVLEYQKNWGYCGY